MVHSRAERVIVAGPNSVMLEVQWDPTVNSQVFRKQIIYLSPSKQNSNKMIFTLNFYVCWQYINGVWGFAPKICVAYLGRFGGTF